MRLDDAVKASPHLTRCEGGVKDVGLSHFFLDGVGENLIEQLVRDSGDGWRSDETIILADRGGMGFLGTVMEMVAEGKAAYLERSQGVIV